MKSCPLKVAGSYAYSGDNKIREDAYGCDGIECGWWVETQPTKYSGCALKILALGLVQKEQCEGNNKRSFVDF